MAFDRVNDREFNNVLATASTADMPASVRVLLAELHARVQSLEAEIAELRKG